MSKKVEREIEGRLQDCQLEIGETIERLAVLNDEASRYKTVLASLRAETKPLAGLH